MGILRRRRRPNRARIAALELNVGLTSLTDNTIAKIDKELEAGKPKRRDLVPPSDPMSELAWRLDTTGGLIAEKKPKQRPTVYASSAYCLSASLLPGHRWTVNDHNDVRVYA